MFFRITPEHYHHNSAASFFMFSSAKGVAVDGDITYQLGTAIDPFGLARVLWEMAAKLSELTGKPAKDMRIVTGANDGDHPEGVIGPADGAWLEVHSRQNLIATEKRQEENRKDYAARGEKYPYEGRTTLYLTLSWHTLRLKGDAPIGIYTEYKPGHSHLTVEVPLYADPFRFATALWELATKGHELAGRRAGVLEVAGELNGERHLAWRVRLVAPQPNPLLLIKPASIISGHESQ